jgi:hypothetical protein
MEWFEFEKIKPPDGEWVLIWDGLVGFAKMAKFNNKKNLWYSNSRPLSKKHVKYWMPIVKPN